MHVLREVQIRHLNAGIALLVFANVEASTMMTGVTKMKFTSTDVRNDIRLEIFPCF
jgi:hypothetical protein